MSLLEQMELRLRQIWHDYQRNLKNESKAKALWNQYQELYQALKRQRVQMEGLGQ